uniref:Uncharacterized protein n=1 Tax=Panagrolaimus sp. JU765 TaxID=591449 RepID=A0AC34Q6E5_9BILA
MNPIVSKKTALENQFEINEWMDLHQVTVKGSDHLEPVLTLDQIKFHWKNIRLSNQPSFNLWPVAMSGRDYIFQIRKIFPKIEKRCQILFFFFEMVN